MRTQLTAEFTALADTEGTFQNTSRHAVIEIATSTTKNTGIVLRAGETRSIKSDDTLYARVAEVSDNTETVYLAHEPFSEAGEGGDSGSYGYRKPSTAYAVGDIAYSKALPAGKKLVCVAAGTTGSGALSPASTAEGAVLTDGTMKWAIDSLADGIYDAAHKNSLYRGADITAYFDGGLFSANVANGNFVNVYPGDYITKTVNLPAITYTDKAGTEVTQAAATYSNVRWLVGACDPHLHCGNTETTAHHVLLIPASTLQRNVKMNPTNDTTDGYKGSDMWNVHMPIWATAIKNAFGSAHVLKHRELLSKSISATADSGAGAGWVGTSNAWEWTDVEMNIPNETMVYGTRVFSSSGFDVGEFPCQLPLYSHKCNHLNDLSWFWLRVVASVSFFCAASINGHAYCYGASRSAADGGIRPYFLLV